MKGILFKPDMIKAIVEGRKTQTRRLGRLKRINKEPDAWVIAGYKDNAWLFGDLPCENDIIIKPRYLLGETVYIKEAWRILKGDGEINDFGVQYGDGEIRWWRENGGMLNYAFPFENKQRTPMFMPAWAARYFITITGVKAERLQEITHSPFDHDCHAEGFDNPSDLCLNDFMRYWNSINKEHPWESNPWVWVYGIRCSQSVMKV